MPRNFHKSHRGKDQDANDKKNWDDVHNNDKDDILIIYIYIIVYSVYIYMSGRQNYLFPVIATGKNWVVPYRL